MDELGKQAEMLNDLGGAGLDLFANAGKKSMQASMDLIYNIPLIEHLGTPEMVRAL